MSKDFNIIKAKKKVKKLYKKIEKLNKKIKEKSYCGYCSSDTCCGGDECDMYPGWEYD